MSAKPQRPTPRKPAPQPAPRTPRAPQTLEHEHTGDQLPALTRPSMPALPAEWQEELGLAAREASATETPSVTNISFRAGVLAVGGEPQPDNELPCIVVGTAYERAYYDGKFNPEKIRSPVCFALTLDGQEPVPHPNSAKQQHDKCAGCPQNEWGSAGEGRRGKACKELRRLAVIPTSKLEAVEDILSSEMAMAKVPVTSVRNWSNYVHKVSTMHNRPFWSVATLMSTAPHVKNQFEVSFDIQDVIDDPDGLTALKQKRAMVEPFLLAPYSMATEEDAPAPRSNTRRKY